MTVDLLSLSSLFQASQGQGGRQEWSLRSRVSRTFFDSSKGCINSILVVFMALHFE